MTDAMNARLRRWAAPCFIAVLVGVSAPDRAQAADTSGLWIGSTYMHATRSTKWVGFSDSSRGDFWFRVDAHGTIHGYAVVADEPSFDSERLNNLIGYIKGVVGTSVGLIPLPGLGAISGVALSDLVGVKVGFDDPMPIRSGPITGRLSHGQLHLDWAGNPKSGLTYHAVMSYVDHDDPLTSGTIAAPAPWPGNAHLGSEAGAALAIATYKHTATLKSGRVDATSVYWTAHRVGSGSAAT
jgi:hypothetical protein